MASRPPLPRYKKNLLAVDPTVPNDAAGSGMAHSGSLRADPDDAADAGAEGDPTSQRGVTVMTGLSRPATSISMMIPVTIGMA